MIEIQGAEGETFTFNVTTNAQGVVLFLCDYTNKPLDMCWSYTDAWSKTKLDDIDIPVHVAEQAKKAIFEMVRVEKPKIN